MGCSWLQWVVWLLGVVLWYWFGALGWLYTWVLSVVVVTGHRSGGFGFGLGAMGGNLVLVVCLGWVFMVVWRGFSLLGFWFAWVWFWVTGVVVARVWLVVVLATGLGVVCIKSSCPVRFGFSTSGLVLNISCISL